MGDQAYALQMGDYSYTIDWMAPAAMPLFMGAELYDSIKNDGLDPFGVMASISEPMMEMSMMQGIRDNLENVSRTLTYGDPKQVGAMLIEAPALNYLSQGLPTLSGQIARTIDPVRRSTYSPNRNTFVGNAEQWAKQQMNKIPGLSMLNEPVIDWQGNEAPSTGDTLLGRAFNNLISPGYLVNNSRNPLQSELERLNDLHPINGKGEEVKVMPSYYASSKPLGENLSSEDYTQYSMDLGGTRTQLLDALIQSDMYKNTTSDVQKAEYVQKIEKFAEALAKGELGKEITDNTYNSWIDMISEGNLDGVFSDMQTRAELSEHGYTTNNKHAIEAQQNGTLDEYDQKYDALKQYEWNASEENLNFIDSLGSIDDFYKYADYVTGNNMKNTANGRNLYSTYGTKGLDILKGADKDKNGNLKKEDELIPYLKANGYTYQQANEMFNVLNPKWNKIDENWKTIKKK
jgi:hypothetical protein